MIERIDIFGILEQIEKLAGEETDTDQILELFRKVENTFYSIEVEMKKEIKKSNLM